MISEIIWNTQKSILLNYEWLMPNNSMIWKTSSFANFFRSRIWSRIFDRPRIRERPYPVRRLREHGRRRREWGCHVPLPGRHVSGDGARPRRQRGAGPGGPGQGLHQARGVQRADQRDVWWEPWRWFTCAWLCCQVTFLNEGRWGKLKYCCALENGIFSSNVKEHF